MAWMAQGFPNDDVWSVDSREEWRTTFSMVRWNFDFDLNYWLFGLVAWFSFRVREVLGSIPRTALATRWEQILEDFPISFQIVCETFAQHLHDSTICNLDDRDDDDESASWCIRNRHCCRNAVETRSARCARGAICKLRLLHVTAVGFEPTPLRTGAWSQRLRPFGQTVMTDDEKWCDSISETGHQKPRRTIPDILAHLGYNGQKKHSSHIHDSHEICGVWSQATRIAMSFGDIRNTNKHQSVGITCERGQNDKSWSQGCKNAAWFEDSGWRHGLACHC